MSIANELSRLQQAKSDLATSITNKGVAVPATTTIDGYAALVDQIQQGGGTLPYDAEVEYLESTGTQYINTLISPEYAYNTKITFKITQVDTSVTDNCFLFGTSSGWKNKMYDIRWNNNNTMYMGLGNNAVSVQNINQSSYMSAWHTLEIKNYKLYIDGVKKQSVSATYGYAGGTIGLFGAVNAGKATHRQVAAFTITDKNNIKLLDFIPVRVGQIGYMYDKVSGELFSDVNGGSFIIGPDVT